MNIQIPYPNRRETDSTSNHAYIGIETSLLSWVCCYHIGDYGQCSDMRRSLEKIDHHKFAQKYFIKISHVVDICRRTYGNLNDDSVRALFEVCQNVMHDLYPHAYEKATTPDNTNVDPPTRAPSKDEYIQV